MFHVEGSEKTKALFPNSARKDGTESNKSSLESVMEEINQIQFWYNKHKPDESTFLSVIK